jgi:hypothetical protein
MFAAVDMSIADAIISVWHAKYVDGTWRPITAITLADTDGNPATDTDPNWMPLFPTRPIPNTQAATPRSRHRRAAGWRTCSTPGTYS